MLDRVEVKIVHERAKMPTYGTEYSAGVDLRVVIDNELGQPGQVEIEPGDVRLLHTGLKVFIKDPNFVGLIFPRSGTGHKQGIVLGNGTGVIDADYNGELMISVFNRSKSTVTISDGQAIAQYVIVPVLHPKFSQVEEFSETTKRGEGGFGHTGA